MNSTEGSWGSSNFLEPAPSGSMSARALRIWGWLVRTSRAAVGLSPYRHIVICGFPRSGTSLLFNMLTATLPSFRRDEHETYFAHRLHHRGNYVTKAPTDVFTAAEADSRNYLGKDIRFVIVIRDVRDVITSRHPIVPDDFFIGADHSWWPVHGNMQEWRYDGPGACAFIEGISRLAERPDVVIVRYEDLVTSPNEVQKRLATFLSETFSGSFADYERLGRPLAYKYEGRYAARDQSLVFEGKPLTQERLGRWRTDPRLIDRVSSQFRLFPELNAFLIEHGYEKDASWLTRLKG